jgi:hypothetical protein
VDGVHLAEEREGWWAVLNMVMNLDVLVASQEGFCFMELVT